MACKYFYNSKQFSSYSKLVEELSTLDLEQIESILYSLNPDKQVELRDKLYGLNEEYKFKRTSMMDDVDINVDTGYTTQTFIDSGKFLVNGKPPMFRMDFETGYLPLVKESLINQGMTEQQAEQAIQQRKDNWDTIAKDATDAHRILVSSTSSKDDRYYAGATLNTSFQYVYSQLGNVVRNIEKEVLKKNKGSYLLKNLNVSAKLRNELENIVGHIDYLCIRPDGTLDIYNLAVSIDSESDWAQVKKEKYKYKLALLKRILEYNGVKAADVRVNLIPIKIKYDNSFQNITNVQASRAISYDMKDSAYTMQKYDDTAATFIDSNTGDINIADEDLTITNSHLKRIFPNYSIQVTAKGIKESAEGWVKHNWKVIASKPESGTGWDIRMPGEETPIHISDTRVAEKNEELVNKIKLIEDKLINGTPSEKAAYRVVTDIQVAYEQGLPAFYCSLKNSSFIQNQLNKYFESHGTDEDGKPLYNWELINNDTLTNANILLFRNKVTNQLDAVTITPFDVSTKVSYQGRSNLLGAYIPDANSKAFTMEANYGNIEAIKTLTLLNQIIDKLEFTPKLGSLKVVGISNYHTKKGAEMDMEVLIPQFNKILEVVNENNSEEIPNNIAKQNTIDPAELMIQTWREAIQEHPEVKELLEIEDDITSKVEVDGTTIDGLETTKTIEGKIAKLQSIIDKIENLDRLPKDPSRIRTLVNSSDPYLSTLARVYTSALHALNLYNGDISLVNEAFGLLPEYLFKTTSIPNSNVRVVGYMFQNAVNTVADRMLKEYQPMRKVMQDFYKTKNYGTLRNSVVGDEVRIFKNLFELDDSGHKTFKFWNPYRYDNPLDDNERKFLKHVLFEINKIRYQMRGQTWEFTGIEDSNLIKSIDSSNYLDVPLEMASKASRRARPLANAKEFGKKWMQRITHPKDAYNEFMDDALSDDEISERKDQLDSLQAYNPFIRSEDSNRRANYIAAKGEDYFETNVENILIDFMEKHIQSQEYQKMLTRTRGILLDLYLKGETEDDIANINHTVKAIKDFLSVSVYNQSIMEDTSKAITTFIEPLRRAVSQLYIAGNVAGGVRDTIQGLFENIARSINKFQTTINTKDVMAGYKEVILDGPQSAMRISILSQLNLKYRLSNMDIAKISEGQKTARSGILNWEKWAYSTLYGPDYLNRMVLFVAQMKHDGVYDAYSLKDGNLVYDWRKDKRFEKYAKGDKSDIKLYQEQRGKYLSLMRMFNQEQNLDLHEGDNIPDAYTQAQINIFKNFSDSIYGAYNQSTKSKYENTAIGRNFLMFSTWMNGIVDNYAKSPQISKMSLHEEQETRNGQKLYFDKHGNIATLEEGGNPDAPVMKDVPDIVQGILYTLKDTLAEGYYNGLDGIKENVWKNKQQQANLRKLFSDLLMALLVAGLFKLVFDPAYKDHKKNGNGQEILANAATELLYKGSSGAFDGFSGPFAMLDYLGTSTNPASYKVPNKIINDTWKFISGQNSLGTTIMNSQALFRSFQDTYKLWAKNNS